MINGENRPKVSVVIPLYNQKQFVKEAIDSVLSQSYPDVEIIVVDDGSTDDPTTELEGYGDRIIVISQENRGLAGARNTGIRRSTGEYLQFLDADDFLHPDKIRLQLEFAETHGAEVTYCEMTQFYDDARTHRLRYVGAIDDMFQSLYNYWYTYPLPVHCLLLGRGVIERFGFFDEELRACEDRLYFSRLAAAGVEFKYFPFIGGFRRQHGYNMNRKRFEMVKNIVGFYRKLDEELGGEFIEKKFGFNSRQMISANLTCIYISDIAGGTPWAEVGRIKKLISDEGFDIYVEPVPPAGTRFKLARLFLSAYCKRWFAALNGSMRSL